MCPHPSDMCDHREVLNKNQYGHGKVTEQQGNHSEHEHAVQEGRDES